MRCYNGCPDSELQAILDEIDNAYKKLKKLNPNAHCTYHHPTGLHPDGYVVHEYEKQISGFWPSKLDALNEAIMILKGKKL